MNLASATRQARRLRRKVLAFQLRAKGFTASMARLWVDRRDLDNKLASHSAAERRRAHRMGFLSHTARWLGVTEENRKDLISERDYWFVQQLNGGYGDWVRDRISALSVFEPHQELFEPTHYQFASRDGELQIIPLSPEAREYAPTLDGLGEFLAERGPLLLTPSNWSTFYRAQLGHAAGSFTVDGEPRSTAEVGELLRKSPRRRSFVLIEEAGEDAELAQLSTTGNAHLRVIMMNPNGAKPQLAEAFVEFTESVDAASEATASIRTAAPRPASDRGIISAPEFKALRGYALRAGLDLFSAPTTTTEIQFFSKIDPATGTYDGARAVVAGAPRDFSTHPITRSPIGGKVRGWQELIDALVDVCRFAPLLTFVEFKIVVTEAGPRVLELSPVPTFSTLFPFRTETAAFLRAEIAEKRGRTQGLTTRVRRWFHNAKLTLRKLFAFSFYPRGLVPYQSVRWLGDMRRDLMQRNGVPVGQKLWAYRHGFLSYRLPQYGITPENRAQFISDLEYRWLRHINTRYKYWLEDKISIKYVAARHNECLPAYYFTTGSRAGKNHLIPLMDCPPGYEPQFAEVLRLAQEKGRLALKPDEGSHGEGFYRLSYAEGAYSLNDRPATEEEVVGILRDPRNRYLVTEFIEMHPDLAKIYPNSVNTIRMIVFKRDGTTPQIGNAYFRIGSALSGFVDNTAVGGMLAEIDLETGRFGNAQALENGRVVSCPRHPDTGVLIEGTLPNWEYAKRKVLEIAADLPQLEYLGFDLAITEDGFKLPEINRFPDYPRIDLLTAETTDYLLYKLQRKKQRFGYEKQRARRIIPLPKRPPYKAPASPTATTITTDTANPVTPETAAATKPAPASAPDRAGE